MPVPTKFDTSEITPLDAPASDAPARFDAKDIIPLGQDPSETTGTISAVPQSVTPVHDWLTHLDSDLRQGGNRTVVGRTLGAMQGRGDKGFSGVETGGTAGAADTVASVPLGAVKAATGVSEMPDHPMTGALKALSGVLQIGTVPAAFMGGPAISKAAELLPSAKASGQVLSDVRRVAGNVPLNLKNTEPVLQRLEELVDTGGTKPKVINDLIKRVSDANGQPITFGEARDFYENLSKLSANEKMALNGSMKRQIGLLTHAFNADITTAADQIGQGARYAAAMKDYARAKQMLRVAGQMGDLTKKYAPWIVGPVLGYGIAKEGAKAVK